VLRDLIGLKKFVYVASESGVVSIFGQSAGGVDKEREGFLGANAHVVAVEPAAGVAYFPLKDVGGAPALRIVRLP